MIGVAGTILACTTLAETNGALANHVRSFAGNSGRSNVNATFDAALAEKDFPDFEEPYRLQR
jgi:hypothetical protein